MGDGCFSRLRVLCPLRRPRDQDDPTWQRPKSDLSLLFPHSTNQFLSLDKRTHGAWLLSADFLSLLPNVQHVPQSHPIMPPTSHGSVRFTRRSPPGVSGLISLTDLWVPPTHLQVWFFWQVVPWGCVVLHPPWLHITILGSESGHLDFWLVAPTRPTQCNSAVRHHHQCIGIKVGACLATMLGATLACPPPHPLAHALLPTLTIFQTCDSHSLVMPSL